MLKSILGMLRPKSPDETAPTEKPAPLERESEPAAQPEEGEAEPPKPKGPETILAEAGGPAARKLARVIEEHALQKAKSAVELTPSPQKSTVKSDDLMGCFAEIVAMVGACPTDELARKASAGIKELRTLLGMSAEVAENATIAAKTGPAVSDVGPTTDVNALQRRLADRERDVQRLLGEKKASSEEAADLRTTLNELRATVDELRAGEQEREELLAGMRAENEGLTREAAGLREANATFEGQLWKQEEELKAKADELEAKDGELEASRNELKASEDGLKSSEAKERELREHVTNWLKSFFEEVGGIDPAVAEELEDALLQGREEVSRLTHELRWRRVEMNTLRDACQKGAWRLARGPVQVARDWPETPPVSGESTER